MFHVIDDEGMLRDLLETIITGAGHSIRCFTCGEAYLEFLNSSEFESPIAVLSDIAMPGISGYALALKIREQHPSQKIVLISGYADEAHHKRAASQLCGVLDKPFRIPQLTELLTELKACDNTRKNDDKHKYAQCCEQGIKHECPFYSENRRISHSTLT